MAGDNMVQGHLHNISLKLFQNWTRPYKEQMQSIALFSHPRTSSSPRWINVNYHQRLFYQWYMENQLYSLVAMVLFSQINITELTWVSPMGSLYILEQIKLVFSRDIWTRFWWYKLGTQWSLYVQVW